MQRTNAMNILQLTLYNTLKVLINMCGSNHVVSNFGIINILVGKTERVKPDMYLDIC